jgi:diguanylate cyclase (GGDEF)-like protein
LSLADTLKHEVIRDPPPRGRKRAMLVVVQGSEADLGAHATVERRVVIGRDKAAELSLADAHASKQHAVVEAVEGWGGRVRYEVRDLGSTNGTSVNGKRLTSSRKLKDGDKISLAETVLRFALADEVDAAFQAQVETMLSTDDLTGLLQRRRFDAALEEAVRAAQEKGQALSLLVMDLDGLKAINDAHGHAVGAYTISEVGRLLAEVLGARGVACRFGGDEFVAFLAGHDATAAAKVAEELRGRVRKHRFERERVVVHPTVSIGVATLSRRIGTLAALFETADKALYRAKGKGKNRVER